MTANETPRYTNRLAGETSPYLLQHAHNPVDWFPWGEEALDKARRENKLLLISVGYSACHWCHVMEHESFEDEQVAKIMNDLFVCIKVDREERPDIDQVYMQAVQIMTGHGGWPLNCFALPDGRPVHGGTYFPKDRWMNLLINLHDVWTQEPERAMEYATKLTQAVRVADTIVPEEDTETPLMQMLYACINNWIGRFDESEGGPNRAPKFALPNNYLFLQRYAWHTSHERIRKHVDLTLQKMAWGGINDLIGGGFARYSTDMLWKVPHFEKMLYDNAQLVSLYSEAFTRTGNDLYAETVRETLRFIAAELTDESGAFYSALDADSEGEEGKFYTWTKTEMQQLLGDDFPVAADYYSINSIGYWEDDRYILMRRETNEAICAKHQISREELQARIARCRHILFAERSRRVRPGLDDKCLTSWNALMLRGYADAYEAFGDDEYLHAAVKNARFIVSRQLRADGGLWHSWKNVNGGQSSINGFLEDYAFVIDAFIALYQNTFDETWLEKAESLTQYVFKHFSDTASPFFFFTSDEDPALIARKQELSDNVIPASNSVMARNLFALGHLLSKPAYIDQARRMLAAVQREIGQYGSGWSNWALLQLQFAQPFYEVALVGKNVDKIKTSFRQHYQPNKIFAGSPGPSASPLLHNRYTEGKTLIYVCVNNTCGMPCESIEEALQQMRATD